MNIACHCRREARPASARVRPTPRHIPAIARVIVNVHGELIDPRPLPPLQPCQAHHELYLHRCVQPGYFDALWSSHFEGTSTRCLSTSCTAKHATPLLVLVRRGSSRPAGPALSRPVVPGQSGLLMAAGECRARGGRRSGSMARRSGSISRVGCVRDCMTRGVWRSVHCESAMRA